jgi:uncharacterized protein
MGNPVAAISTTPTSFHVLAKPTGAICNLDCKYCYFLSKEVLYPGSEFRMSEDLLEKYIRQLLAAHQTPEVTIAWQGGEPTLMGLEFFERGVALVERYRKAGQCVEHTIQTNGTKLDDGWCAFFKKHNFLVGLSVDGPRELHDAYRVDKGGQGTYERVMGGWDCLRKHGVEFNILCTVHATNVAHPLKVYRFFRDELKARYLQFIPIVERVNADLLPLANLGWGERGPMSRPLYVQGGDQVTHRSVGADQFGRFLAEIFDEWVRRDVGNVYVQMFDTTLGAHVGMYSVCVFAPTCGDAVALEHNGDLYSCDHFVEPDYKLGNIQQNSLGELVASERQRKFGRDKRDTLPKYCRDCDVRFACNGGCPKDRFIQTPDGEPGLNYLCEGYKRFFQHVDRPMRIMANLLQRDLAPAEIMALYAWEDAKWNAAAAEAGRNEPCPCGSGKKSKHCHSGNS